MKPDCSIVIRAYNEEKHIGKLLDGMMQQSLKNIQIILVDSGSTDNTVAIASKYPVEIIHIQPQEFTFGRSLNAGIAQANADFVVFASAHVYPVYPDWLEKMLEPFADERIALSYGKQRGAPTTQFSEHQIFAHWFPEKSLHFQGHPFCNNANAAIRRSIWQKRPYQETLPALEDLDWAQWAHDQGYGISYVAEAEIIHVHHESLQGVRNRYRREGMAFKQIYPQEKFGLLELITTFFSNINHDFSTAKLEKKWGAEWRNIIAFRWNQFYGTYLGYRQSGPLTWQLKQAFYYPRNGLSGIKTDSSTRNVDPIQYQDTVK